MNKKQIKILVVFLLLFQLIAGLLGIFKINQPSPFDFLQGINPIAVSILLAFSLFFSVFFVLLIFRLIDKKAVSSKENVVITPAKETAEAKQKKEQENLRIKALNEKKEMLKIELMKALGSELSLEDYCSRFLINVSRQYDIFQGIFFVKDISDGMFKKAGTYAFYSQDDFPEFAIGVGLTGQVALNKKILNIENIPEKYITVLSGLGKSSPGNLMILPIIHNNESIGIVELASFVKFDSFAEQVLNEISPVIGSHIAQIKSKFESN
jgi:hypothetical protein